ncbi:tyrosine-type recombinase/integrase [Luteibacter sp.]|uniref:tyrosine-type recombinase/integrase n=1 Tax=Luteibacter sp. TaxID=1886636 RepID=UPI0025BE0FCA|nr:tyrosine-type recombinase/integrase [Luteibacter sp.]
MMVPAPGGKLTRRTYGADLHRMLDEWARTWGATVIQGDTVAVALDAYLGQIAQRRHRGEIQESTEKDYRKHVDKLRQVFGAVRLVDVDVPMLVRWRDVRAAQSPTQFNLERTNLLEAFKVAVERGMVPSNPVAQLGRAVTRPRDRYASDEDVNILLQYASRPVQAAIMLAVSTGLRQGDILTLKLADFDDTGLTIKPNKTKGKTRKALHFPWSPGMRLACELAATKVAGIGGHWLRRRDGQPYTSDGFRTLWHKAMTKALAAHSHLARFTFHDLRAKAGTDGEDWQLLGHLDQKTHSRVYDRKPKVVKPAR